ncbi:MAG: UvrD-helicase domain-containing protein [Oscillospiraceae bacterium]
MGSLSRRAAAAMEDRAALLVSAAAGSGKTKVLVERLFGYMSGRCRIDDFLIITFTKAAAASRAGSPQS